jgi:hypothetical protein
MTQPLFGRTAGTHNAAEWGEKYGVDFIDLHFHDDKAALIQAMDDLNAISVKYVLNFEGAPVGWVPCDELKTDIAKRPGFLTR